MIDLKKCISMEDSYGFTVRRTGLQKNKSDT